ncbi:MAG TPA: hypothetical protein VK589_25415 [Chryseolinea sp.]|nr:hypothetical protein [Chryseolinea sp.]
MKTTSDALKSIKAQVKYMIDNQYYATVSIIEEQNEMFSTKRSANDQNEISEFFDFQLAGNSEVMHYVLELRECLTEAIDTPAELPAILNRLEEEASKGCNDWILEMFSDVIEYMEQLSGLSAIDHSRLIKNDGENILKAA